MNAQKKEQTPLVGIFAPLYLDSIFNVGDYKYAVSQFPRFTISGFDFVQGALMAMDSLSKEGVRMRVEVFDSKSTIEPLNNLIKDGKIDDLDLIIGSVKEPEFIQLAEFARKKKIPFISVTYPNVGGIKDNPYTIIMNSTLRSHCDAIFAHLLQNHGTEKILFVRKSGNQEERIERYFNEKNELDGWPLLKMETIILDSNYINIQSKLDSTRTTVVIAGSMDERFASSLSGVLFSGNKKYPVKLIGMPNWEGFNMITKPRFKDFSVYYTSPYFNKRTDSIAGVISERYFQKFKGYPTDFALRGYESTYQFASILHAYPDRIMDNINNPAFRRFNEFQFRACASEGKNSKIDYYENKHLYILRTFNGQTYKAW